MLVALEDKLLIWVDRETRDGERTDMSPDHKIIVLECASALGVVVIVVVVEGLAEEVLPSLT